MKYTTALSLLIATATALPQLRAGGNNLVDQFNGLSNSQKAQFLQQIAATGQLNVDTSSKSSSSSGSGDVQADVNALALDDGQADVTVGDSGDVALASDILALDDGKVNVNINGLEDVLVQMQIAATNGAAVNVSLDQTSTASWGENGGADCDKGFEAKRIIASMGFCVQK